MDSDIQATINAFTNGWVFLQKKGKETAAEFTKIYTLSMGLSFLELLILLVILLMGMGSVLFEGVGSKEYIYNISATLVRNVFVIAALSIPVILVFRIINAAVGAVTYLVVGGKKTNLMKDIGSLMIPVGGYAIAAFLLQVAIFIVPAAIMIIAILAGLDGWIIFTLVFFLLAITFAIWIVVRFLIQFGMLELVIHKNGVIGSIKTSIRLVKENWKMILIFDVAMFVVLMAIGIITQAVMYILQVFFYMAILVPPLIILVLILFVIFTLIQSVLTGLIVIPTQYLFWKSVKRGANGQ